MHEVVIESLAFGGEAVGHLDGKAVFVPFAAPGDRVRLRILRETASYCRAELLDVLVAGEGRRSPPCPYFGRCGGCQWQQLDYPHQLEHKRRILHGALAGLVADGHGGIEVRAAPRELGYRRRVRMHWQQGASGLVLGYQRWRSRELLDVARCPLLEEPLQRGVDACRPVLAGLAGGAGTLVALIGARGEVQISLRIEKGERGWLRRLARQRFGEPVVGGTVQLRREPALAFGALSVELPGGLRGSAAAFVQASVEGEETLRRNVLDWAAPAGRRVLELHAGIGTFTRALAATAQAVVAVELSVDALPLLRANCAGLPVQVRGGDAGAAATELAAAGERFGVVVLDPPREGSPGLASVLARLDVPRVVYVSCDPMTLGRDLRAARGSGFEVNRVVGVDLMPQSYHIEAVALLSRR